MARHGHRLEQDACEDVAKRRAVEREAPRQALECDGTERPQVGAKIDRLGAASLLRAHVRGRAKNLAHLSAATGAPLELRDAEVDELCHLVVVLTSQEYVLGFEVAVHDPCGVRARKSARDLRDDATGGRHVEPLDAMEAHPQVFADEPLHRDEGNAVPEVVVEDADDVRTLDLRDRARLEREARRVDWLASRLGGHEFHRAPHVESQMLREPDRAHGPAPELAHELEAVGDDASGCRVHGAWRLRPAAVSE